MIERAGEIPHFRGVFMKDALPTKPLEIECGILNLQNSNQPGSHWTAWYKTKDKKYYFDSYGDVKPPIELVNYLDKEKLFYNTERIQDFEDPPVCGHLCLLVLKRLSSNGELFEDILRTVNVDAAIENYYIYKKA